jgi:RNA polymerase sigma-70 factor (ECF subfamily)
MRDGDRARSALLVHSRDWLVRRTRRLLRRFPRVRGREQTDDVVQNALIRLQRALATIPAPENSAHWWNIAAQHLHWELLSLADRYHGWVELDQSDDLPERVPDPWAEPVSLDAWTHFHEAIARLPDELRQVIRLLWYGGLTQQAAATVLGISLSTLQRRWFQAQFLLSQALQGRSPE